MKVSPFRVDPEDCTPIFQLTDEQAGRLFKGLLSDHLCGGLDSEAVAILKLDQMPEAGLEPDPTEFDRFSLRLVRYERDHRADMRRRSQEGGKKSGVTRLKKMTRRLKKKNQ